MCPKALESEDGPIGCDGHPLRGILFALPAAFSVWLAGLLILVRVI
jgi:hypothetical protein